MRAVRSDGMTLRGLEMAMIEYRVRPVTRWVVTRKKLLEMGASSPAAVGEFPNGGIASIVAEAMAAKDGGEFLKVEKSDLTDIPLLLRRIASQIEDGELSADFGVLTLRSVAQRRPTVFGFGPVPSDPYQELELAATELDRLAKE